MAASVFGPATVTNQTAPAQAVQPGFVDASGKLQPGQIDPSGNIKVAVTGAGSGGTSSVDETAFAAGVTAGTPAMGVFENTPSTLTDGQLGVVAVNANRELKVEVTSGGGSNASVGPTGDPVPAEATFIGADDGTGDLVGLALVKLDYATDGSTVPQSAMGLALPGTTGPVAAIGGAGAVSTQVQRTTLASDDPAVVALQIIDDWDETNRAAVNLIAGQLGVQGGAGASTALTQRVAIATDANDVDVSPLAGIFNGVTNVTTAGTQVALASSQAVSSVTIKAKSVNTGLIYIGGASVSSADGFQLSPGDSVSLDLANLATVFVDSAVNGEGVSYVAVG